MPMYNLIKHSYNILKHVENYGVTAEINHF